MRIFRSDAQKASRAAAKADEELLKLAHDRIQEVVEAAARAAREIRARAGDTPVKPFAAKGIVKERIAIELAASLADRAEALSAEADELASILARARAAEGGSRPQSADEGGVTSQTEPEGEDEAKGDDEDETQVDAEGNIDAEIEIKRQAAPGPAASEPASADAPIQPERGSSEGLRLLANQMAVAGSSRDEIERRLREDFGVSEPGGVLREVFGPEAARGNR